jgi:hypothetical protein
MADSLCVEHMEKVSWRVLADYAKVARDMLRGRHGIYVLYRREKLYYVGLARSLMGRVNHHLKDRHRGAWDRFSVYLTVSPGHIRELEALIIRIASPPSNKQTGRLKGASDLRKKLNQRIRDYHDDQRALLLGGDIARARRRRKARRGHDSSALAGAVERPTQLLGVYKGKKYKARLRRDGQISFRGRLYATPAAAARAALGRGRNGWYFWQIRLSKGGPWERSRALRR